MKENEVKKVTYIDRSTGQECVESIMGDGALRFAYETALGRTLWGILFGSGFISALLGKYYDSPLSRGAISKLTSIPGCHTEEAEKSPDEYNSFNDFFIRKLKPGARNADPDPAAFVSPGDGRLTVYCDIAADAPIKVKGATRSLQDLCVAKLPPNGIFHAAVLRLAPVDYHRYHYPCDCTDALDGNIIVPGKYHSVNPVALKYHPDIFVENTRQISVLANPLFGTFYQIAVGAFGVGSIVSTSENGKHLKMDEKGYFKFGGSTIIIVLDSSKAEISPDISAYSAAGKEVLVRCGETIARAI